MYHIYKETLEKKKLISRPSRRVQKSWTIDFESLDPYLWFEILLISGPLRPKKLLAIKITNNTVKRGNFFFSTCSSEINFFLWKSCLNQKLFCHINSMTSNYILRGKSLNSVKIDLTPRANCEMLWGIWFFSTFCLVFKPCKDVFVKKIT